MTRNKLSDQGRAAGPLWSVSLSKGGSTLDADAPGDIDFQPDFPRNIKGWADSPAPRCQRAPSTSARVSKHPETGCNADVAQW